MHQLPLEIYQGQTFELDLTYETQAFRNEPAEPIDLTDATVAMQIRRNINDADPILDLSQAGYITISEPLSGKISINLPPVVTRTLSGCYVYDIDINYPNGVNEPIIYGNIKVYPEVTR